MRISQQPAFILHHRPYRETSAIIELLTQDYGRIAVVGKGVKGARATNRGILQPFTPLVVSWHGRSELASLCSVEAQSIPFKLQGDCLLSGFYINELLIRLLHKHDPYPALFTLYHETLIELQKAKLQQKTLRIFEKKLLAELGYGIQLQCDIIDGKSLIAEQTYYFRPEQGFTVYQADERIAEHLIFSGESLLALMTETLDNMQHLRDAKRLMRLALAPLLGSQPLHSRKLFVEVELE